MNDVAGPRERDFCFVISFISEGLSQCLSGASCAMAILSALYSHWEVRLLILGTNYLNYSKYLNKIGITVKQQFFLSSLRFLSRLSPCCTGTSNTLVHFLFCTSILGLTFCQYIRIGFDKGMGILFLLVTLFQFLFILFISF